MLTLFGLMSDPTGPGVSRWAAVERVPPKDCLIRVLESMQDVRDVRYELRQGGRPITWMGVKVADKVHYYFYEIPEITGGFNYFYFVEAYKGQGQFQHEYVNKDESVLQVEADAIRPVMRQLERQMETMCDLRGLAVQIHESCSGVKCVN